MARVNSDTSLAHLSLDFALAPTQKDVDATMIGIFDETLRLAQQPQYQAEERRSAKAPETRPSNEARETNETRKPEPRERDDVSPEEVDTSVTSEEETNTPDEVEAETTQADSADEPEESTDQKISEEEDGSSEEKSEETEQDGEPVVATILEDTVIQPSEKDTSLEVSAEKAASAEQIVDSVDSEAPVSQGTEAATAQKTTDVVTEEAAVEAQVIEETAGIADEDLGEEPETEQKQSNGDIGKAPESDESPDTDAAELSQELTASHDSKPTSEEVLEDGKERQATDQQPDKPRGEKREGHSSRANATQDVSADVAQPVAAKDGPAMPQIETTPASPEPQATIPEAVTADVSTPTSGPQATPSGEAVTAVESRATNIQSRVNTADGTGKGTTEAVDSAKFVQRVANAFTALGQRSGPVRLKLYPPELGSLRMEITVKNGTLSAKVEAETAAARSLLVDNLPMLRERLSEQGIRVDRFDVGVSDQSQGGSPERPDDGGGPSRHAGRENGSQSGAGETEGEPAERYDEQRLQVDGRLDVFI